MDPPGRRRCSAAIAAAAGSADAAHGDDGVLLVLGTDTDDDLMRLRAGETISGLLLSATALGLVVAADRPTEADPRPSGARMRSVRRRRVTPSPDPVG